MNASSFDDLLEQQSRDLAYVIRSVGERGIADRDVEADDYSLLLTRREFSDVVVGELYEVYFLPERHEFDCQLLHQMVSILTSEKTREFIATTVASGVLGNGAFAVLRSILERVLSEMSKARLPKVHQQPFYTMKDHVAKLERFFGQQECARIAAIESFTRLPREEIYPLLKLLGFKHHRRANNCYWCRPGGVIKREE